MVDGQPAASMKKDQDFPISIEAESWAAAATAAPAPRPTCAPGTNVVMNGQLETRHCVAAVEDLRRRPVGARGDRGARRRSIVHRVNGEIVLEYEKPQLGGGTVAGHDPALKRDGEILTSGSISLQAESHPLEFRKVELLNLAGCMDKKAKNYKSYFEKDDPTSCQY